jgi:hypothetical protein
LEPIDFTKEKGKTNPNIEFYKTETAVKYYNKYSVPINIFLTNINTWYEQLQKTIDKGLLVNLHSRLNEIFRFMYYTLVSNKSIMAGGSVEKKQENTKKMVGGGSDYGYYFKVNEDGRLVFESINNFDDLMRLRKEYGYDEEIEEEPSLESVPSPVVKQEQIPTDVTLAKGTDLAKGVNQRPFMPQLPVSDQLLVSNQQPIAAAAGGKKIKSTKRAKVYKNKLTKKYRKVKVKKYTPRKQRVTNKKTKRNKRNKRYKNE